MNKHVTKKIFVGVFASSFLLPFFVSAQTGNHFGEQKFIDYRIEYLSPLGVTVVDETGITYQYFENNYQLHEDRVLPGQYFDSYPLYFAGGAMQFRLFIKNTSNRTYRNLKIETFQEFLNISGGRGEAMGGNYQREWLVDKLGSGEEIVLSGEFDIPLLGASGIDQTHLRISHQSNSDQEKGQIIIEDFQAGLWCPT